MERDAHYFAVGLFVMGMLVAGFLFAGLFQRESAQETSAYAVHFSTPIGGLSTDSDVRYMGLKVGEVTDIALLNAAGQGALIEVRLLLQTDTPVDTHTVAILRQQGVTGLTYVDLGREESATDTTRTSLATTAEGIPLIPARLSELDTLLTRLPLLEDKLGKVLDSAGETFNPANRENIAALLANLKQASDTTPALMQRLGGLEDRLGRVLEAAEATLDKDNRARLAAILLNLQQASADAPALVKRLTVLEDKFGKVLDSAGDVLNQENRTHIAGLLGHLDVASAQTPALIGSLHTTTQQIGQLAAKAGTGLDSSLQALDNTLQAVRAASYRIDRLATDVDRLVVSNEQQVNQLVGQGSEQLKQLLGESRQAARALKNLSDSLQKEPARILFRPAPQGVELPR